ncbi:hypothetical protein PG994_013696 [Apiospora phragmitis]|uniref:Uncharacterized protein n=1 Tax=Apiospora phragmitis TaxID=2905665 RepID=A0ABR1T9D6_9PEZI
MSESPRNGRSQPWKLMHDTPSHAAIASTAEPDAMWDNDHSTSNQNTNNIVAHIENDVTITSVATFPSFIL